ncbi:hypothetical protein DL768_010728 [Monosporascus sp. mg162]|nr:hypothetical protein DL768_010728 [Monosporascus sp. mg162]
MPLKKSVSGSVRNTVRDAFKELDRTVSRADSRNFALTTLEEVKQAALDVETQLAARQSMRNMRRLKPLFDGLNHYHKPIEILCNGTPYLPWVWGPLKLILQIATDYVYALEEIVKAYSSIGDCLERFNILYDAFTENESFQQTLAVFLADIAGLHKEAYKLVRRSCWKVFFRTSWGRFQRRFDQIIADLKSHADLVDKAANAHNIAAAQSMRQDLRQWREESMKKFAKDEEEQAAIQYQSVMAWLQGNSSVPEQNTIIDSIAEEASNYPGTGSWLLTNNTVLSWLRDQVDPQFLWLKGKPGSGKSVIATQLLAFLKEKDSIILGHFCSYAYSNSVRYDRILTSLISQLLQGDSDFISYVYGEYFLEKKTASITVGALEQLLTTLLQGSSIQPHKATYVRIIVDGLDECDDNKQQRVITLLNRLAMSTSAPVIKVLVSCRDTALLKKELRRTPALSLYEERQGIQVAIASYAARKLAAMQAKFIGLEMSPSDVSALQAIIVERSEGMFLWARLVLEYISNNIFYSREEVASAASTLPKKLSDFYGRILSQVTGNMEKLSILRIQTIFQWVTFARRPLRIFELRSALYYSFGYDRVSQLPPEDIFDKCGQFLARQKDGTFTFIHFSAAEYLKGTESGHFIRESSAIYEHALACLAALISGARVFGTEYPDQDRMIRIVKGLHGFHLYAYEHWIDELLGAIGIKTADGDADYKKLIAFADDLLEGHPQIRIFTQLEIQHREDRRREFQLGDATDISNSPLEQNCSVYRSLLELALQTNMLSGITHADLEWFKSTMGPSAYTCRLNKCPRGALKAHISKYHVVKDGEIRSGRGLRRIKKTLPGTRAMSGNAMTPQDPTAAQKKSSQATGTTPASDTAQEAEPPTPATPVTPVNPQSFDKNGPKAGAAQQTANAPASAPQPAPAPVALPLHPDPNGISFTGMDSPGSIDFAGIESANPLMVDNVLQDFDFDPSLHDGDLGVFDFNPANSVALQDFDGIKFANPLTLDNVLQDFDFDSFLPEDGDPGAFDFNPAIRIDGSGEITAD